MYLIQPNYKSLFSEIKNVNTCKQTFISVGHDLADNTQ